MPNAQWPSSLQDRANSNYTETIDDGVIRTQPDVGPSQSRPRYTKTRVMPKLSIWVGQQGYKDFFDFYNIDLVQGVLPFDWHKPTTNEPATLKFSRPPTVSSVGPLTWEIACEFEEI
jgi:hypothetical protein